MAKIAVIQTGGKQYPVKEGSKITIEKLDAEVGSEIKFDNVLLIADEDGSALDLGNPNTGKTIVAKVLEQKRSRKIRVGKFQNKTRHHKVHGHRQHQTVVEIQSI
ncbi:MAG TPA: 50S ribosomal protein L21 [bacterium]|nr:50S ribosomal protein L21 [bacterium]